MSFFVTGLTGFVGTNLIKEIRSRYPNKKISALILPNEKKLCNKYEKYDVDFFFGSLDSRESLESSLEDVESVFHLAAVVDDLSPMKDFYRINHIGTKNILDEAVKSEVKTFIYLSTLGVYGFKFPNHPIDETFRVDLIRGYRESKYLGELEVFKYADEFGFKASALRPPIIFGPGDHWAYTIFNLVESNRKVPFINKGKVTYSYSYIDDIVETLIKMEQLEKSRGEVFNHTSYVFSKQELFDTVARVCKSDYTSFNLNYNIAKIIGLMGELQWKLFKKRPLLDRYRVNQIGRTRIVSTEKIEKLLGVKTKKSFEEALTETYNWYVKDKKK